MTRYKVTVEALRVTTEHERVYLGREETGTDTPYATAPVEKERSEKVYEQIVDELELSPLIMAVNNL